MTLRYFQIDNLEPAQDERLRAIFSESKSPPEQGRRPASRRTAGNDEGRMGRFTPAVVEQLANEHDTVDEYITALEARL